MTAAEREKQIIMSRPDILHPIDEKMVELAAHHRQSCAHHSSGLYTNNVTIGDPGDTSDKHSDDSVWWIKQQQQQQQQHECGCDCQYGGGGGGMRDAMSLPHLSSPQMFRHIAPQYYSQVSLPNRIRKVLHLVTVLK